MGFDRFRNRIPGNTINNHNAFTYIIFMLFALLYLDNIGVLMEDSIEIEPCCRKYLCDMRIIRLQGSCQPIGYLVSPKHYELKVIIDELVCVTM